MVAAAAKELPVVLSYNWGAAHVAASAAQRRQQPLHLMTGGHDPQHKRNDIENSHNNFTKAAVAIGRAHV